MTKRMGSIVVACAVAAGTYAVPRAADAFCGFYVGGADTELYNNATVVVLMRDGTRTVLSMENNYEGPPENFAMVVPVPVVLSKTDVKTLDPGIFDRVDAQAAPRLVEYWEQDPCYREEPIMYDMAPPMPDMVKSKKRSRVRNDHDLGVKIEAQFEVGEYEIVILSAKDSLGLDTWLRREKYAIPQGAQKALRPYVQSGMKFFVAKVNVDKASYANGQAVLSPLRFHYDSKRFALPVRLGLLNSSGTQDLLIHVLARGVRYEVANYENVAIPTNLDVVEEARSQFGSFYAALFDRLLERNPGSVVTEYAWGAGSCDPCPTDVLSAAELTTLGADVLPTYERALRGRSSTKLAMTMPGDFVLTRLHARYGKGALGEDLVFKAGTPIEGGREVRNEEGLLEEGVLPSSSGLNNFQARYAIRHPWTGPIECDDPVRGIWAGRRPASTTRGRRWLRIRPTRRAGRSSRCSCRAGSRTSRTRCPKVTRNRSTRIRSGRCGRGDRAVRAAGWARRCREDCCCCSCSASRGGGRGERWGGRRAGPEAVCWARCGDERRWVGGGGERCGRRRVAAHRDAVPRARVRGCGCARPRRGGRVRGCGGARCCRSRGGRRGGAGGAAAAPDAGTVGADAGAGSGGCAGRR